MKIVKEGINKCTRSVRFKCLWCCSILEADMVELTPAEFDRNQQYYDFYCPVCMAHRIVSECDWKAVYKDE